LILLEIAGLVQQTEEREETVLTEYDELKFEPKQNDWMNASTNKPHSGYLTESGISSLLDNIDKVTE
jgi:hypothetical protein